jgi:hypothetical protein
MPPLRDPNPRVISSCGGWHDSAALTSGAADAASLFNRGLCAPAAPKG